jgi:drug/metabolite transporter (DMT)-like permease
MNGPRYNSVDPADRAAPSLNHWLGPAMTSETTAPTVPGDPGAPETPRAALLKARLFLVILCLGWGVTWVTMRIALTEIPPFSMRVATLFLGTLTMLAIARLQGRSLRIADRRTWLHLTIASLFNIVGFSIFTPFAQLAAATSRVAIVVYTMPIWASLLALPILGERLNGVRAVALLLCVGGLAILTYPLLGAGVPTGVLLALGAAVSWGAGTVYLKWARLDGDPMAITVWQLVIGLAFVSVCVPIVEGSLHLDASAGPLAAVIFSGIVGSGIAYFLWFDIVRRLPASTASLGVLSVPAIGVIASVVILGEQPTFTDMAGFALMFCASACVLLWPQDAAPRRPAA